MKSTKATPKDIERALNLAQYAVLWSTTRAELVFRLFEDEAKGLGIPVNRQVLSMVPLPLALVGLENKIKEHHGETLSKVFLFAVTVSMLPLAKTDADRCDAKATAELMALKMFDQKGVIAVLELLAHVPCPIENFVSGFEELKTLLASAPLAHEWK